MARTRTRQPAALACDPAISETCPSGEDMPLFVLLPEFAVSLPVPLQARGARGPAGGRTPRASACGCIGHSAASGAAGRRLEQVGKVCSPRSWRIYLDERPVRVLLALR